MRKIRKGDDVIVVTGKDKGKRGNVVSVLVPDHVIVSGVNMIKRHTKPNPNAGVAGGIVEKEAPIHVSNVMMFNAKAGKGDRVGIKLEADGRKVRYFKSDSQVIDV